jgi:hypothetical protein
VFPEDGCEYVEKFYLELCIKYFIYYAGAMRCLMFHMSCGCSVEFCLFSFVDKSKYCVKKLKFLEMNWGKLGGMLQS